MRIAQVYLIFGVFMLMVLGCQKTDEEIARLANQQIAIALTAIPTATPQPTATPFQLPPTVTPMTFPPFPTPHPTATPITLPPPLYTAAYSDTDIPKISTHSYPSTYTKTHV